MYERVECASFMLKLSYFNWILLGEFVWATCLDIDENRCGLASTTIDIIEQKFKMLTIKWFESTAHTHSCTQPDNRVCKWQVTLHTREIRYCVWHMWLKSRPMNNILNANAIFYANWTKHKRYIEHSKTILTFGIVDRANKTIRKYFTNCNSVRTDAYFGEWERVKEICYDDCRKCDKDNGHRSVVEYSQITNAYFTGYIISVESTPDWRVSWSSSGCYFSVGAHKLLRKHRNRMRRDNAVVVVATKFSLACQEI